MTKNKKEELTAPEAKDLYTRMMGPVEPSTGEVFPLVKNQLNAKFFPKKYELNALPSMTIPDQTMSMQEILDRFSRGLPVGGEKFPIYHGEEDLPDFSRMDLAEVQEYRENAIKRHLELQEDWKLEQESAKREAMRKYAAKSAPQVNQPGYPNNSQAPEEQTPKPQQKK